MRLFQKYKNKILKSRFWQPYFTIIILLLGFILGKITAGEPNLRIQKLAKSSSSWQYIRPLLAFEISEKKEFAEFKPLGKKIKNAVSEITLDNEVDDVGVYFRDLNTGRWTGVNENHLFAPGSLLKVPLMIGYLKRAETDPGILGLKYAFSGDSDNNERECYKPAVSVSPGEFRTVDELLKYMIVYSDNLATGALLQNIDRRNLNEVYSDLGMELNEDKAMYDSFTPKEYSLFFRVL